MQNRIDDSNLLRRIRYRIDFHQHLLAGEGSRRCRSKFQGYHSFGRQGNEQQSQHRIPNTQFNFAHSKHQPEIPTPRTRLKLLGRSLAWEQMRFKAFQKYASDKIATPFAFKRHVKERQRSRLLCPALDLRIAEAGHLEQQSNARLVNRSGIGVETAQTGHANVSSNPM